MRYPPHAPALDQLGRSLLIRCAYVKYVCSTLRTFTSGVQIAFNRVIWDNPRTSKQHPLWWFRIYDWRNEDIAYVNIYTYLAECMCESKGSSLSHLLWSSSFYMDLPPPRRTACRIQSFNSERSIIGRFSTESLRAKYHAIWISYRTSILRTMLSKFHSNFTLVQRRQRNGIIIISSPASLSSSSSENILQTTSYVWPRTKAHNFVVIIVWRKSEHIWRSPLCSMRNIFRWKYMLDMEYVLTANAFNLVAKGLKITASKWLCLVAKDMRSMKFN